MQVVSGTDKLLQFIQATPSSRAQIRQQLLALGSSQQAEFFAVGDHVCGVGGDKESGEALAQMSICAEVVLLRRERT